MHVVVRIPTEVAIVVEPGNVGLTCAVVSINNLVAEADDRVLVIAVIDVSHSYDVTQLKARCGHLDRIQELAQALTLGHCSVKGTKHLVKVIFLLLVDAVA